MDKQQRLRAVAKALPAAIVTTDQGLVEPYLTEWRQRFRGASGLLIRPRNTEEVALALTHCHRQRVGVVPQGGNTGLCGGAIPSADGNEALLSLERLNRIRELNPDQYTMTAEAGCVLAQLQQRAGDCERRVGVSLASEGSCQLGGILSTNAGGNNVIHYGSSRDQVLGLEVVLADGGVLNMLRALRKDNTGYDLKQIFIGAEGTLGVITAATIKLHPAAAETTTLCLGLGKPEVAQRIYQRLTTLPGVAVHAVELMPQVGVDIVLRNISGTVKPFPESYPWLLLLEAEGRDGEWLWQAMSEVDGVLDGVLAGNQRQVQALWRIRESFAEAQKLEGASLKHDVAVPLNRMSTLLREGVARIEALLPGARAIPFGHVGDGNIHFNVSAPVGDPKALRNAAEDISATLYQLVAELDGSCSAEHGIGQLKQELLLQFRSTKEVDLMSGLKRLLDPHNIMNPGKVLPKGALDTVYDAQTDRDNHAQNRTG